MTTDIYEALAEAADALSGLEDSTLTYVADQCMPGDERVEGTDGARLEDGLVVITVTKLAHEERGTRSRNIEYDLPVDPDVFADLVDEAPPSTPALDDHAIIAFSGEKGAGKSTTARELGEQHHLEVTAFGNRVKDVVEVAFDIERRWLERPHKKEQVHPDWGITSRRMMQQVGQAFRERFGRDFWIRRHEKHLRDRGLIEANRPVIVDDVRYPNEAEWVRDVGGVVVGVDRPGHGGVDDHESERLVRDRWGEIVDAEITNDPGNVRRRELPGRVIDALEGMG